MPKQRLYPDDFGRITLLPCMRPMPNHVSANCGNCRVLPEGMSQMFRLLYLGNGWADCVEIWHALGDPLVTAYAVVTDGVSLHVRTCTPRFCISQTAWPIVFKFGVWVSSHHLSAFHKSSVGYHCTCARADRASVSQERLGRLSSVLVCSWGSWTTCLKTLLNTMHGSQERLDRLCSNLVCGLEIIKGTNPSWH